LEHVQMKPKLTFVDLFAVCGGLSLGMERAGFFPIFVNEINTEALQTYLANRVNAHPHLAESGFHCNDVKGMVSEPRYLSDLSKRLKAVFALEEGDLDLVVGGPPCQGYSGIGHRRSYSVDREQLPSNHLYQDMAYVVHTLRPKAFVFENVRGLLNARWTEGGEKGEIFRDVYSTLRNIPGYRVAWKLVFAKDYGVPQNRPRVLVIGIRDDVKVLNEAYTESDAVQRGFLPAPGRVAPPSIEELLGDLVDPAYFAGMDVTSFYPHDARTSIQKLLRTSQDGHRIAVRGEPVSEHEYSRHAPHVVAKFKAMLADPEHRIPPEFRTKKFAQRVLPRSWGAGGPTITATSLPDDYVHFEQPRSLTVREWARLQMFPDWYSFSGKRTTGGIRRAGNPRDGIFEREVPKYTQIGNAVPVKLAEEVGKHLASILGGS
jgi:DNA (cytosine-5)-methyltransferase 1